MIDYPSACDNISVMLFFFSGKWGRVWRRVKKVE